MNHPAVDAYLDELLTPVAQAADGRRDAANEPDAVSPSAAPPTAPTPRNPEARAALPDAVRRPLRGDDRETAGDAGAPTRPVARWLRAGLGRDRYAFQLLRVQEVVRVAPVVAMRGAAAHVLGVMNLRGRIVPVIDLAKWLGTGQVEADERSRIIVLEHEDELMGVLVGTLDDVASIAADEIEQPFAATAPGAVLGIARAATGPTVLLDATALFH